MRSGIWPRRLLIVEPWWCKPSDCNWSRRRGLLRYVVLEELRGPTYVDSVYVPGEYKVIARRWTWRRAATAREAAREAR